MGHIVCPYPDELLDKWDSVANPIGKECEDCEVYECEHNLNYEPYIESPIKSEGNIPE